MKVKCDICDIEFDLSGEKIKVKNVNGIVKLFKAYMLLMIFLLSLLPEPFMLKHLGITLRADTLVLWMAGIEAVDAWDEYKREKNKNKSNHGSGVKKNGKNKKETRV